jgi:uncharacterized protein (TIGR04168 family)
MTIRMAEGVRSITVAVVGDIHDQWSEADGQALKALAVDLVLFVGDIGNEAVGLVRQIAALDLPKAVILGNHDAWYSATDWGRKKCPYDRAEEDRVLQQLEALGQAHVGYGKLDLPSLGLTIIGGRPFSWGGPTWKNADFYRQYYGVNNFEESVALMRQAIDAAAHDQLIFMGHCGPTGLGSAPEDPCGRDWNPIGGDFGDPDLTEAIAYARAKGKTISLVAFGHMHHGLRHRKDRLRQRVCTDQEGTLLLNAASVPRWVQVNGGTQRNFSLVKVNANQVQRAALVWVDDHHQIAHNEVLFDVEKSHTLIS